MCVLSYIEACILTRDNKNSPIRRVFIENAGVAHFLIMCYTVFGSEAELTTTKEVCYE